VPVLDCDFRSIRRVCKSPDAFRREVRELARRSSGKILLSQIIHALVLHGIYDGFAAGADGNLVGDVFRIGEQNGFRTAGRDDFDIAASRRKRSSVEGSFAVF